MIRRQSGVLFCAHCFIPCLYKKGLHICSMWKWFHKATYCAPESIEWFIENQGAVVCFGPFPSPVNKLSLFLSLPVGRRSSLQTRGGQVVGEEPKHTTERKLGTLQIIQYSLLYSVHRTVPFKRRVLGALSCFLVYVIDVPTIYNPHCDVSNTI